MTKCQLEILQHTLGRDQYGRPRCGDRNYFASEDDSLDAEICHSLVRLGFMRQHGRNSIYPGANFSATEEGKAAMLAESPQPPKTTRSQERYRRFLDWKEAYGGTLRQFLAWQKRKDSDEAHG